MSAQADLAFRSPLVEGFRQGGVPLDVRQLAARGGLAPTVPEQLQLLMLLASDPEPEVASTARATIARLPSGPLAAFLANPDVPADVRAFFTPVLSALPAGVVAASSDAETDPLDVAAATAEGAAFDDDLPAPPVEAETGVEAAVARGDTPADIEADPERRGAAQRLSMLTVAERMKVAMQGTREERSILVRDANRLVSSSVLSSPKLTESEIEAIARMTNVSDDVLRVVGTNRQWTKSYSVVAALTRNPKTPVGVSLTLLPRLSERDVKVLSTDRNVPEPIRLSARKIYSSRMSRRD